MSHADPTHRAPLWQRLFFIIPVIGWVARDLMEGDSDTIWYAIAAFVSLWLCCILLFGIPGLYIPAVSLVPLIVVGLVIITFG